MPTRAGRLTPASPKTGLARLNPENGPISSSLTAIRRRLTRDRSAELGFWRRGWRERRSSAGLPRLHRLSAGYEHRRGQDLRQLFRRLSRRVPQIERDAGPAAALEEAGDRRIAIGPIPGEDLDLRLAEHVAHFAAVDRRGFVDLAGQAPVGGEINEQRVACRLLLRDRRFAPSLGAGHALRHFPLLRQESDSAADEQHRRKSAAPRASLASALQSASLQGGKQQA